jgi:PD-(D/E)XK nuclease superfamily
MRLSQGHLSLLETCPRQFQHQILEQLSLSNLDLDLDDRLRAGSEFHQIMQQRSLQLPIEVLLATDAQLTTWFRAFETAEPALFTQSRPTDFAESEQVRTLTKLGYTLVVVYDCVILDPEFALILDWKTYGKPHQTQALLESWQSRLYPYVLSQTSHYAADHIEMRYWFFQPDGTAQPLRLPYSRDQAEATDRRLTDLLTQLTHWLKAYTEEATPFPQTDRLETCDRCPHAIRCGRSTDRAEPESGLAIGWEQIPEIV